jgi:hypothetical protein
MNELRQQKYFQIPQEIFDRDGPFDEFTQDAAIVTIELKEGKKFGGVLVLYPNYIIGMKGMKEIPFDPAEIHRVYQSEEDQRMRTDPSWTIWDHPWKS